MRAGGGEGLLLKILRFGANNIGTSQLTVPRTRWKVSASTIKKTTRAKAKAMEIRHQDPVFKQLSHHTKISPSPKPASVLYSKDATVGRLSLSNSLSCTTPALPSYKQKMARDGTLVRRSA